jgi:hypothetical protein
MRYYPDENRPGTPCPEFEALGLAIRPYIPPDAVRMNQLPDWLPNEPARMERGSAVLRWVVVVLLLGFVGLVLVTPTVGGKHGEMPAYATD